MLKNIDKEKTEKIIRRLKRLEGQVRGIRNMVESGRNSLEVLRQITSVNGALNGLWVSIASAQIKTSLRELPIYDYAEQINEISDFLKNLK